MKCATPSQLHVVPPMTIPEALRASHDPSFDTARNEANDSVLISASEACLNVESTLWAREGPTAANDELPVEHKNCEAENSPIEKEYGIIREMKSTVTELVANRLSIMIKKFLEERLSASFKNAQSSIESVVYKVVEQVVLDLLRKEIMGETMDSHIAKLFDTDAACDRLWKSCWPQLVHGTYWEIDKGQKPKHSGTKEIQYCFHVEGTDRFFKNV